MNVSKTTVRCLRNRGSSWYLSISPLHHEFRVPTVHSSSPVRAADEGWASVFDCTLKKPSALPLNPINPDNARTFRITAAAGTELAGPYSCGTCNTLRVGHFIPAKKEFNWPIFLTAASRRSLDRVSVPMWGTFLSEPLLIVALVGRYPANKLIRRIPIPCRYLYSPSDAI